ncbi:DUF2835 domain-containing protein [Vibrio salinus]|uniref:DUF2835 domain-containing protein n=1 Tax=Vibrio salinus TaxID=2899784 RepID=UPI001E3A3E87|nr:DUF2835 domain-containing protein [Vibrio salinus]MCE0492557.1 DUF2835 domain-containing protein [Vibrio salinus]
MKHYYFSVYISYLEFQRLYTGSASVVVVTTEDGLKLQLPAIKLRPYLSQLGIRGRFRLTADNNNKFIELQPV